MYQCTDTCLKGHCHKIFDSRFFHQSTPLRSCLTVSTGFAYGFVFADVFKKQRLSDFGDFRCEYLGEYEAICETILTRLLGTRWGRLMKKIPGIDYLVTFHRDTISVNQLFKSCIPLFNSKLFNNLHLSYPIFQQIDDCNCKPIRCRMWCLVDIFYFCSKNVEVENKICWLCPSLKDLLPIMYIKVKIFIFANIDPPVP
jgi:hypothetical protein